MNFAKEQSHILYGTIADKDIANWLFNIIQHYFNKVKHHLNLAHWAFKPPDFAAREKMLLLQHK